jgi:colanic acid/amylovoran biosynthesis protein
MMPIQMASSCFSAVLVKIGLKGFYRSAVCTTLKNSDAVISCSDENFKEAAAFLPLNVYWIFAWWSMLVSRTWDVLITRFLGKPVVMFPNSVGPFRTLIGKLVSKSALKSFDFILIREPISYEITESLKIGTPRGLTFDTTWIFKPDDTASVKGHFNRCIGVSPGFYAQTFSREEIVKQTTFYAEALDEVVEQLGLSVLFLPHYVSGFSFDDAEISQMVIQRMRNRRHASILQVQTADEFKLLLDQMNIVVSAKMHPAVLALSGTVPTLCIAYDHKQTGLFNSLEMSECVISIEEFSRENLKSKILYVWNNREQIRARLRSRVPLIQKNVKDAIIHTLSVCPDLSNDWRALH